MKINKKYLAGSVAVLALSVCSYELGRHQAGQVKKESNRVSYIPNHSYLSQLDVTYKTPDLMSHFLPPHEVSFTFCCSSIVFPR
ncbi:TPA: pneumococcal-type histidine triad protein [Streptococcus pneumoniae]